MCDEFTVEMTAVPIANNNWCGLYDLMDRFSGALLIEDPDEPMLIVPVSGFTDLLALGQVRSVVVEMGVEYTSLRVYPAEDPDGFGLFDLLETDLDASVS